MKKRKKVSVSMQREDTSVRGLKLPELSQTPRPDNTTQLSMMMEKTNQLN
jgi:hypothetical protein